MFKILKYFGKKKIEKAANSAFTYFLENDTDTASEAQIAELEDNLKDVTQRTAAARADFKKEQAEADAIIKTRDENIATAEYLQTKLGTLEEGTPEYTETQAALLELITEIEEMQPEVERELSEAAQAKEFLQLLEETSAEQAATIKRARSDLKTAATRMKHAKLKEEQATQRAERQAELNGLRSKKGQLTSVLDAMNARAEEAEINAEAAVAQGKLLNTEKPKNAIIEEAKKHATGTVAPQSLDDRLAALKNK